MSIPGQFVGCIFGIILFRNTIPFVPLQVLQPIVYNRFSSDASNNYFENTILYIMIKETIVVMLFTFICLVIPNLLYVNKLPYYLSSILLFPLMCVKVGNAGSTFHPVALYCLWYLSAPDLSISPTEVLRHSLQQSDINISIPSDNIPATVEGIANITMNSINNIIFEVNQSINSGINATDLLNNVLNSIQDASNANLETIGQTKYASVLQVCNCCMYVFSYVLKCIGISWNI